MDYPASDYALTYYFRGTGEGIDAAATVNGEDFDVVISAADTAKLEIGNYKWQAVATKDAEVFLLAEGLVAIKPGLVAVDTLTTHETRSANKIILDKISAMISGSMDKNVQEYTINNRQLKHYTLTELIALEKHYSQKVSQEVANTSSSNSPFLKSRKFNHLKAGLR